MAFLVVTPSRAGCKLTALFPATGFGVLFARLLNQLVGYMCGVPLSFVPHLLWFLITIQTWIMERGGGGFLSAPPLALTFAPFIKTGFAKIFSSFVIFFQLAGFSLCACVCQISINSTISYAVSLSTKVCYGYEVF